MKIIFIKNFFFVRWFNKTMFEAFNNHDRILLLAHVPFGIDELVLTKFYNNEYQDKLLSIINQYSKNIIMCFSAHRHQDTFGVYSTSQTTMGILAHPSITPRDFYSEPSIRYYSYNRKSLILNDYEQYILNLIKTERTKIDEWILSYRFSSWYHQTEGLTSEHLLQLVYLIGNNTFYLKRFLLPHYYRKTLILTKEKIIQTLCSLLLFNFDEFMNCTKTLPNKQFEYKTIIMNYSLESNVLRNEQFNEDRYFYPYMTIVLMTLCIVFYWNFKN